MTYVKLFSCIPQTSRTGWLYHAGIPAEYSLHFLCNLTTLKLTNCLAWVEGGCLGYPGASTVASQPLDRILPPWLANPRDPAMSPHSMHRCHWWNSGRKKNKGWDGGKTLNEPLHRPLHKRSTKYSQILAVYKATTYHVSLHLWNWPLDTR